MSEFNVLSYGGGVQSTALIVLAARGLVKIDAAIFVELDAENPETVQYVREVAEPYAIKSGIKFLRVSFSLMSILEENLSFPAVPFPDKSGKIFGKRQCTYQAKVRPFRRALRALMKEYGAKTANVSFGISIDEIERVKDSDVKYIKNTYPLVDLLIDRQTCRKIIDAEIPIPPKSSCYFCPFSSSKFQLYTMTRHPELLRQAASLERRINSARRERGLDELVVVRFDSGQQDMFDAICGGHCHT